MPQERTIKAYHFISGWYVAVGSMVHFRLIMVSLNSINHSQEWNGGSCLAIALFSTMIDVQKYELLWVHFAVCSNSLFTFCSLHLIAFYFEIWLYQLHNHRLSLFIYFRSLSLSHSFVLYWTIFEEQTKLKLCKIISHITFISYKVKDHFNLIECVV